MIDVREVPISRKKGFSKNALCKHLADVGIDYLHLKGLGDPKPGRVAARAGQFDEFRRIFGAHMKTEVARSDLDRAIKVARANAACLLCFERDHTCCHRCIVANKILGLPNSSYTITAFLNNCTTMSLQSAKV